MPNWKITDDISCASGMHQMFLNYLASSFLAGDIFMADVLCWKQNLNYYAEF